MTMTSTKTIAATPATLEAAQVALARAGYTARLSHDETYLALPDAAPDSDGESTEPGSAWWEACDTIAADVTAALGDGYEVAWADDDLHVTPR